ncbi:MAG TPA: hypothetical protein VMT22_00290 [Terriglobales bacterium]|nr:hypothetical protein [Terriglobales bacterium]
MNNPGSNFVRNFQDFFEWVPNIKAATMDYLEAVEVTRTKLKEQHGVHTEIVRLEPFKPGDYRYVVARDVDENRIKIQVIHPGQGITLNTDELLLNDLGLPFEAILMVLDRNESEVEDRDRV